MKKEQVFKSRQVAPHKWAVDIPFDDGVFTLYFRGYGNADDVVRSLNIDPLNGSYCLIEHEQSEDSSADSSAVRFCIDKCLL